MRVGPQPLIARPIWFDRNPSNQILSYIGANLSPHGPTVRGTFTVSSGRKAITAATQISLERVTAATTPGCPTAYISYTPSGGSPAVFLHASLRSNTVGARVDLCFSNTIILNPGDQLQIVTLDDSVGGTMDMKVIVWVTSFDA